MKRQYSREDIEEILYRRFLGTGFKEEEANEVAEKYLERAEELFKDGSTYDTILRDLLTEILL